MPTRTLPPAMEKLRLDLGDIVTTIEAHAPYGAVLLSSQQGQSIYMDNRQETVSEKCPRDPTAGTVLTAFDGETVQEQALSGYDKERIIHSARKLAQNGWGTKRTAIDPGPERQGDFVTPMKIDPSTLSTEDKLERCRDVHQRVKALDPRIVNVRINYLERRECSVFRNRNADLAQDIQRVRLMVLVVVSGDNGIRFNWRTKTATAGWEALTFSDDELQTMVENAIGLLTADRIEPGEYTVVTSPTVSGIMCHESFGHGVETDMFLKDRAKAAYYLDREVGSSIVNISDDPSVEGAFGSYSFDDEGFPAQPTRIVEAGIFQRGITDLYSATTLGIPRSPNGRRQDYRRKAYARMSNTFFERGTTPVEELFQQVENGIYLEKWSSGMEDPKGWGIQVTCHFGREIKGGQLTGRMFAPIVMTGYVPEVLQSIKSVGDEWVLDGGTCGKGHKEYAPVASGGPHLLLRARLG
jgi:TldD protein